MNKQKSFYTLANINARLRLVCFPYAGGNSSTFHSWGKLLPKHVELTLVQLPGRAARFADEMPGSMEELIRGLVADYQLLKSKPTVFFGHSMGAKIAYELDSMINRMGLNAPKLIIVSGSGAPNSPKTKPDIHNLPDMEFVRGIIAIGNPNSSNLNDVEFRELVLPMLRADFRLVETYSQKPDIKIDSVIAVLAGKDDEVTDTCLRSWFEFYTNCLDIRWVEGGHFFVESNKDAVIDEVNYFLEKLDA